MFVRKTFENFFPRYFKQICIANENESIKTFRIQVVPRLPLGNSSQHQNTERTTPLANSVSLETLDQNVNLAPQVQPLSIKSTILDEEETLGHPTHFFVTFLQFLNCTVSTNNCYPYDKLRIFQKIIWWTLYTFAVLSSLILLKYPIFDIKRGNIKQSNFLQLGLSLAQLFLKLAVLRLVAGNQINTAGLAKPFEKLNNHKRYRLSYALPLMSFVLSILFSMLGFAVIRINLDWSFAELTFYHCEDIYNGIFVWKSNATEVTYISFSRNCFIFSTLGFLFDFAAFFTELLANDLLLISAICLSDEMDNIELPITQFLKESDANKIKFLSNKIMNIYKTSFEISEKINSIFGFIFVLVHVNNLFVLVNLIDTIIQGFDLGLFIWYVTGVTKFALAYFYCLNISQKVSLFRSWVRKDTARTATAMESDAYNALLDELDNCSIGIGQADSYVNWRFIKQFMKTVFTYFFIMSSTSES